MKYGCYEQIRFESWETKHIHNITNDGSHYIVGNGRIVMRAIKPWHKIPYGSVTFIGIHDGSTTSLNEFGKPFNYADYFLPEEICVKN